MYNETGGLVNNTVSRTLFMSVYGHYFLNIFFRPLVEVKEDNFYYRGKWYNLKDVVSVEESDNKLLLYFMYPAFMPKAKVKLNDGSKISLNGRALGVKDEKMSVNFTSNKSIAYEELVAYFQREIG